MQFTKTFKIALVSNAASVAFLYPEPGRVRKHGPKGYEDLQSFRPWLRDEFSYRCVYCLKRETWVTQLGSFDIDHLIPRSIKSAEILRYENLLYACHGCNLRRGNRSIPHPETHLVDAAAYVSYDGVMVGLSDEANEIIDRLTLNSDAMIEYRLQWNRIVELTLEHKPELLNQILGYPLDAPNLKILQPSDNTQPRGVEESIFARRDRSELKSELYLR